MATVTGLTAARMLAIEAASVVDGEIVGDDLILTRQSGSTINAGDVRGPQGDPGPTGSDLAVVTTQQILDVGIPNQICAGRVLAPADFTDMGLSIPIALWNLSNVNDSSGNGRTLTNKGSVAFGSGILGVAASAARFTGASTAVLYIADTGAADPFRVKMGTFGAWVKTAKRGTAQAIISKYSTADGNRVWWLAVGIDNAVNINATYAGAVGSMGFVNGATDVADDRWHFVVGVYDGSVLRLYIDGVLDAQTPWNGVLFSGSGPINIGGLGGDAGNNPTSPFFGSIDEAFATGDVLSEDQIRNLYCAKILHTLGAVPKRVNLNVRRNSKGGTLVTGDFPSTPDRLYNFTAGSLSNQGSDANGAAGSTATLQNNGAALSVPGVPGTSGNAFSFFNQTLSATDTGLPLGTAARSIGCWFKTVMDGTIVSYGANPGANDIRLRSFSTTIYGINGSINLVGPFITDGNYHFAVFTQDSAAVDGVLNKLYLDGKLVASSTSALQSITGTGSNRFRVGSAADGTEVLDGRVDGVFVYSGALTAEQIAILYAKGQDSLKISPKNAGDHVEAMDAAALLCTFDRLESQDTVDLVVA